MDSTAGEEFDSHMIFEHIDRLKKQYTDKYVVVDESRPELKRFRGLTGMVKTVNMSGRALVEFDGYNNIGWYDIDPTFLKVVDAPVAKPVESKKDKAAAPKAQTEKAPAAAAKPVGEKPAPAAKPAAAAGGKGMSVADILAAAKANKAAAPAAKAEAKAEAPAAMPAAAPAGGKGMSVADILAAARTKPGAAPAEKPAAAPAKPAAVPAAPAAISDPKKMSVADIIAAAKGNKPGAAPAAAAPVAKAAPTAEPVQEPEPVAEEPEAAPAAAAPARAAGGDGKKSKKDAFKTAEEMVAYCRKVDAK